jgi:hypothetical protein
MFDCAQILSMDRSRNEGLMGLLSIEHSRAAYRADIAFYVEPRAAARGDVLQRQGPCADGGHRRVYLQ